MVNNKSLESAIYSLRLGQFLRVSTATTCADMNEKQLKRKSPYLDRLSKKNTYVGVRLCDYENMGTTKEKREQGIEAITPTWWSWVRFPYIARHNTKGTLYLVVKTTTTTDIGAEYFVDGNKVLKSEVKDYLRKESEDMPLVCMLKLDSITEIQQGEVKWVLK
mgnify:FL=1